MGIKEKNVHPVSPKLVDLVGTIAGNTGKVILKKHVRLIYIGVPEIVQHDGRPVGKVSVFYVSEGSDLETELLPYLQGPQHRRRVIDRVLQDGGVLYSTKTIDHKPLHVLPQNPVVMFYYVGNHAIAQAVAQTQLLEPDGYDIVSSKSLQIHGKPSLIMTTAKPEDGRKAIAPAVLLPEAMINYGLEMLVDKNRISAAGWSPQAYSATSEDPILVHVLRIWAMDKVERRIAQGYKIHRYNGTKGIPGAFYGK